MVVYVIYGWEFFILNYIMKVIVFILLKCWGFKFLFGVIFVLFLFWMNFIIKFFIVVKKGIVLVKFFNYDFINFIWSYIFIL